MNSMSDINTDINIENTADDTTTGDTASKNRVVRVIVDILLIGVLIGLDQVSKYFAVLYLKDKQSIIIWDRVFELCYLENRGAAFGIMQNQKLFFLIVASIMILVVLYFLIRIPSDRKYLLLRICMMLIGAGAVGNMIDRLTTEYVVDFFYFVLINFPIFNVADIYVTVSCAILIISILFIYKEDDLKFLKVK